jgi:hypothetical protein
MALNDEHQTPRLPNESPYKDIQETSTAPLVVKNTLSRADTRNILVKTHKAADKLMAGLGNTFRYETSQFLATPRCQKLI